MTSTRLKNLLLIKSFSKTKIICTFSKNKKQSHNRIKKAFLCDWQEKFIVQSFAVTDFVSKAIVLKAAAISKSANSSFFRRG